MARKTVEAEIIETSDVDLRKNPPQMEAWMQPALSDEEFTSLSSYADALALAREIGLDKVESVGIQEFKKESLLNKPLLIVEWKFAESKDFPGTYYAFVKVILEDGSKGYFTDGSTGIFQQLATTTKRRIEYANAHPEQKPYPPMAFLECKLGLRKSEYRHIDGEIIGTDDPRYGKAALAATYYI